MQDATSNDSAAAGDVPPLDEELSQLRSTIIAGMARIPDDVARKEGWFARFNWNGDRPPMFWCFNNWVEAAFLGHWLGPRQPLFAMHSLRRILAGKLVKKLHTQVIAEVYATQLLGYAGDDAVVLGGNCQAAPIAEAMAHTIITSAGKAPLLITLEQWKISLRWG